MAVSLSVIAAACTAPARPEPREGEATPPAVSERSQRAGLLVFSREREGGPFPTEGSLSLITITPERGPVLRGVFGDVRGGGQLIRVVPAGTFEVTHVERRCEATCLALEPPISRCVTRDRMPAGAKVVATVVLRYGGCALRLSEAGPVRRHLRDPRVFARPGVPYRFEILSHCGIGHPIEFDGRFWVPREARYRRGFNAPRGFDFNTDEGTMTLVDAGTARYVSSGGTTVVFEPFHDVWEPFVCY